MTRELLRPKWILSTLLAVLGVAVLIRLGIWQLDRLAQRRAFNARVEVQLNQPALDLNQTPLPADLWDMEYRAVQVRGRYVPQEEVLLRNQAWQDRPGYHLLTPLVIEGGGAKVLVDRGWIPFEDASRAQTYAEPGLVTVTGIIRRPQTRPDFGGVPDPTLTPGQTRLDAWNIVNLDRIRGQVDGDLLPVYVLQAPDPAQTTLPYRSLPQLELTEGPHFGYALQWFTFAAMLAVGYPFFVRRQLRARLQPRGGAPQMKGRMDEPVDSK